LKGGFGYAEKRLDSGESIAAVAIVNGSGSPFDPRTGRLWADRLNLLPRPSEAGKAALAAAQASAPRRLNTVIGAVLTDASLTKSQASKLAAVAHDGLARAVRPVHSMSDGDTIFSLASGRRGHNPDVTVALKDFNSLLADAADIFNDACQDGLLAARNRGEWRSYRDLTGLQSQ
jgi:L-aminopeptidase/D-esterase-like protein